MDREEGKRPDQKPGHEPERPEDPRVFFRIMMGGMCQISGKLLGRSGMTFLACPDDVLMAQRGTNVGDWEYLVRPVTVRTFGCLLVSQLNNLPVECLKIGLGDIHMTFSANIHNLKLEIVLIRPLDSMR